MLCHLQQTEKFTSFFLWVNFTLSEQRRGRKWAQTGLFLVSDVGSRKCNTLDYNAAILNFLCVIPAFSLILKGLVMFVKVLKGENNAKPANNLCNTSLTAI